MPELTPKAMLDLRAWAIGTWPADDAPGVDPRGLYGAHGRQVAIMRQIGWVEVRDKLLHLSEAGKKAVIDLLPAKMPKLTASQEELLETVLRGNTGGTDLGYLPALKLIAYGAVHPKPQRFGGYTLHATQRGIEWGKANAPDEPDAETSPAPR